MDPACYAPSIRYEHLARSSYGVGHTAWRQPGNMRGTVVGKKGKFRARARNERRWSLEKKLER